jgi:hypothetical protein
MANTSNKDPYAFNRIALTEARPVNDFDVLSKEGYATSKIQKRFI